MFFWEKARWSAILCACASGEESSVTRLGRLISRPSRRFFGPTFVFLGSSPGHGRHCNTRSALHQLAAKTLALCLSDPAVEEALYDSVVMRTTPLIKVTRSLPSSSSRMPLMVQPTGVVTAFLSRVGWCPVASTTLAAPSAVWGGEQRGGLARQPDFHPGLSQRFQG